MSKISKSLIDEFIRVCKKYWKTGDIDVLDKKINIAEDIELETNKSWSIWEGLLGSLCRLNVSSNCIYGILETIGVEVELEHCVERSEKKGQIQNT